MTKVAYFSLQKGWQVSQQIAKESVAAVSTAHMASVDLVLLLVRGIVTLLVR